MKFYSDSQEQAVAIEPDALQREVFKIVISEIVSDRKCLILPWEYKSSEWDMGEKTASWCCQLPGAVRMTATILFDSDVIQVSVELTNLSARTWELANAFTCFSFYDSPLFDCPRLDRIMLPIKGEWRSVAEILSDQVCPGHGPCAFFPIENGPALDELWICRKINQSHSQRVQYGAACVLSRDGKWVAGINTANAGYVFINRHE